MAVMTLASGEIVHLMTLKDNTVVAINYNKVHDKDGKFGTGGGGKTSTSTGTLDRVSSIGSLKSTKSNEFAAAGDPAMGQISKKLGLDAKPVKFKQSEVSGLKKQGYTEMYRGYRTSNASKFKNSYTNDSNMRVAYGVFGSGTYMTANKSVATFYGDLKKSNVGHYLISPDAKGITYKSAKTKMLSEHTKVLKDYVSKAKSLTPKARKTLQDNIKVIYSDTGRWAAFSGYDYITYQGSSSAQEMSVLNRGKVGVVT
jgi:hypothetical protein